MESVGGADRALHPETFRLVCPTGAATEGVLAMGNGRLKVLSAQTSQNTDGPVLARVALQLTGNELQLAQGWIRGLNASGKRETLTRFFDVPVTSDEEVELSVSNNTGSSVTVALRVIVE